MISVHKFLFGVFVGLALGVGGVYVFFIFSRMLPEFDLNNDGKLDAQYLENYSTGITTIRVDRNYDNEIDAIYEYLHEVPISEKSDDNFDGFFDTTIDYNNGLISKTNIDTNQNGKVDVIIYYEHGVLNFISFINEENGEEIQRDTLEKIKILKIFQDSKGNLEPE